MSMLASVHCRSLRGFPTHSGGASYALEWSSHAVGEGRIVAFATEYGDVTVNEWMLTYPI